MTKYKIRTLNLLDIRHMARILKELNITKDEFKNTLADVFNTAMRLTKEKQNEGTGEFVKALMPALDSCITLLAESDAFWEFLASLLNMEYVDLAQIGLLEVKDIFAEVMKDEQFQSFFISISALKKGTTAASSIA